MNDNLVPTKKIKFDKERTLRLDLNALCRAEKVTGRNFLLGGLANPDYNAILALIWAMLLHEDPKLTFEEVGSWFTSFALVQEAVLAISELVNQYNPPEKEEQPPFPKKSPQHGSTSGVSEGES